MKSGILSIASSQQPYAVAFDRVGSTLIAADLLYFQPMHNTI
jgi:hypothetical protein